MPSAPVLLLCHCAGQHQPLHCPENQTITTTAPDSAHFYFLGNTCALTTNLCRKSDTCTPSRFHQYWFVLMFLLIFINRLLDFQMPVMCLGRNKLCYGLSDQLCDWSKWTTVYKQLGWVIEVNYVTLGNNRLTCKNHRIRKALVTEEEDGSFQAWALLSAGSEAHQNTSTLFPRLHHDDCLTDPKTSHSQEYLSKQL